MHCSNVVITFAGVLN